MFVINCITGYQWPVLSVRQCRPVGLRKCSIQPATNGQLDMIHCRTCCCCCCCSVLSSMSSVPHAVQAGPYINSEWHIRRSRLATTVSRVRAQYSDPLVHAASAKLVMTDCMEPLQRRASCIFNSSCSPSTSLIMMNRALMYRPADPRSIVTMGVRVAGKDRTTEIEMYA